MALCCSRQGQGSAAVVECLPPLKPIETLEGVLDDKLASIMLLKYAESEFNEENVLFLLEVHQLNQFVSLKSRLRRMLTRRSDTRRSDRRSDQRRSDQRRSDVRRSDPCRRTERELRRCSTNSNGLNGHNTRAIELTRSIIKRHVASNNLCLTENIGGALRKWLKETDEKKTVPNDLIGAAYAMTLRTVKHDIFPRFRRSTHFDQLLYVHLGRTLQHDGFRRLFEAELTPSQQAALAFWRDARTLEESAVEGEEEATGDEARRASLALLSQHGDQLMQLCSDEYDSTRQALDADAGTAEGGARGGSLLGSVVHACQNQLVDPYVAFLASEKSQQLLKELGVGSVDLSSRTSVASTSAAQRGESVASVATLESDPEDWAAGW